MVQAVVGNPATLIYGGSRFAPNLIWYGDFTEKEMTVIDAIALLDGSDPIGLSGLQRFMLMARVQRAAKLGDTEAQQFVTLCELNTHEATKH